MQQEQFLPVNWVDGMKINKSHFLADANASRFQQAQGLSGLTDDYNYGLLPAPGGASTPVKIQLTTDNQQLVQLRISRCRAITRGGHYVYFDEQVPGYNQYLSAPLPALSVPFNELEARAASYYVVLCVNPYKRIPFGAADPAETPPRLPFTISSCTLDVVPVTAFNGNAISEFHMPLGLLHINHHRVQLDDDYIPPCHSVSSHHHLLDSHGALEAFYFRIETLSLQIIQKIHQKNQANDLAQIAQKLCELGLQTVSTHLAGLRTLGIHRPAIYLLNDAASLARLYKNTLDMYVGSGKEEFVNYCTEWCDISQAELEGCLTALVNQPYDHLDIRGNVEKLMHFTKTMLLLFGNLARLDYIGKRKEAGIFVKEKTIAPESEGALVKRRSFLAD